MITLIYIYIYVMLSLVDKIEDSLGSPIKPLEVNVQVMRGVKDSNFSWVSMVRHASKVNDPPHFLS